MLSGSQKHKINYESFPTHVVCIKKARGLQLNRIYAVEKWDFARKTKLCFLKQIDVIFPLPKSQFNADLFAKSTKEAYDKQNYAVRGKIASVAFGF